MNANPRAPELPEGFAWLNTDRPLTFADTGRRETGNCRGAGQECSSMH